jgi:hypothetical protein
MLRNREASAEDQPIVIGTEPGLWREALVMPPICLRRTSLRGEGGHGQQSACSAKKLAGQWPWCWTWSPSVTAPRSWKRRQDPFADGPSRHPQPESARALPRPPNPVAAVPRPVGVMRRRPTRARPGLRTRLKTFIGGRVVIDGASHRLQSPVEWKKQSAPVERTYAVRSTWGNTAEHTALRTSRSM